jgi:hypothetical protein
MISAFESGDGRQSILGQVHDKGALTKFNTAKQTKQAKKKVTKSQTGMYSINICVVFFAV